MSPGPGSTPPLPPGPPGHPLWGHLPAFRRDPLRFLAETAAGWGDVAALRIGPRRACLIRDPDDVARVLHAPEARYDKRVGPVRRLRAVLGRGLVTSGGALWRRERRLIRPAFGRDRMAGSLPAVDRVLGDCLEAWAAEVRHSGTLDVHRAMMRFSFEVAGAVLFGDDLGSEAEAVRGAMAVLQRQTNERLDHPVRLPLWLPTGAAREFRQAIGVLDAVVARLVRRREAGPARDDLLGLLLEARRAGTLDDRLLRDEVVTLLLAGHENTGNALTWMLELVARNPEVGQRVAAEVDATTGRGVPRAAEAGRYGESARVAAEALRLYPTSWLLLRRTRREDVLGGYRVRAGTIVIVSPWLVHRHPAHWPEPERFLPERFLPDARAGRHPFAWIPFGSGPRRCVGAGLAELEMPLVLAAIASRFDLAPVHPAPATPEPVVSLPPRGGLRLRLTPRCATISIPVAP
ncbi:MAG TPA: cytochrome P450 [Gemmatimonadales bacterium]|nr:cytochrome P450 [Gemmatimonadales bacterium]